MPVGMLILAGVLLVVALGLLAVELFLPSHGVLTIFALFLAICGVIVAYLASPTFGVVAGLLVMIASPIAIYWAIKLYPETAVGKRVMLGRPPPASLQSPGDQLAYLMGKRGIAMTMLRPAGAVEIDGHRIDCVAESALIEADTTVEVVRVMGKKVVVQAVT